MKKAFFLLCAGVCAFTGLQTHAQTTIRVMDTVLFFDGYAAPVATPPPPAGIIRHRNDLYARMLTASELQSIGSTLKMKVTVKAACDNYDRIGNVNLALVPKGSSTYSPDNVQRIEIARYITPFMNKNRTPTSVSYNYDINNVAALLKETSLIAAYDFWVELQVFGVPYAANTQVSGCAGRNDVFYGSLEFTTDAAAPAQSSNVLLPLLFQKTINNYDTTATDTLGKTTKTVVVNVPGALTDAALFLITSNHGANAGGEEYNRRQHYAYFDNDLKLSYLPGRTSCEPFRQYNTQGNGIYGNSPRTDAEWQSFSNWCPGDKIDIRRINLGPLAAGNHTFTINVPDAVFVNSEGYFPVSLYLQGKTSGVLDVKNAGNPASGFSIYPNPSTGLFTIETSGAEKISEVAVLNTMGAVVYRAPVHASGTAITLQLQSLPAGLYLARLQTLNGPVVQKLQIIK